MMCPKTRHQVLKDFLSFRARFRKFMVSNLLSDKAHLNHYIDCRFCWKLLSFWQRRYANTKVKFSSEERPLASIYASWLLYLNITTTTLRSGSLLQKILFTSLMESMFTGTMRRGLNLRACIRHLHKVNDARNRSYQSRQHSQFMQVKCSVCIPLKCHKLKKKTRSPLISKIYYKFYELTFRLFYFLYSYYNVID